MKLKSLGILMMSLLLLVAATSSALLMYVASQFDSNMQQAKTAYANVIEPLRQIDANTKNLRFHLLAAFNHNPDTPAASLHAHPVTAHTAVIRSEIENNTKLWASVSVAAASFPSVKLADLKRNYGTYFQAGIEPGVGAADTGRWMDIVRTVSATLFQYNAFEHQLQEQIDALHQVQETEFQAAHDQQQKLIAGSVVTGLIALALATILVWKTVRSYSTRLNLAVSATEAIAHGDLSQRLTVAGNCEATAVLRAIQQMQTAMRDLVGGIRGSADNINAAASEVALGNADLSARTEQQAGALEETASSMEELASTVKHNADNAQQASQLAESASAVAAQGGAVVAQVVQTMDAIDGAAKKIVDIISVIDGIAFQTNILALNAAVEAARAGEEGRGFAVVASEVRNLAQRSATAAKEIKLLIGDSVSQIEGGTRLAAEAGTTMDGLVSSVRQVTGLMSDIAAASQEQTAGINQINQAIIQMDDVTQQNAALVEEASAAALALQDQAAGLIEAVSVFTLGSPGELGQTFGTRGNSEGNSSSKRNRNSSRPLLAVVGAN